MAARRNTGELTANDLEDLLGRLERARQIVNLKAQEEVRREGLRRQKEHPLPVSWPVTTCLELAATELDEVVGELAEAEQAARERERRERERRNLQAASR